MATTLNSKCLICNNIISKKPASSAPDEPNPRSLVTNANKIEEPHVPGKDKALPPEISEKERKRRRGPPFWCMVCRGFFDPREWD